MGMSPEDGAEESVRVNAEPVAAAFSVPLPPTEEPQFAASTIQPPRDVIGSFPVPFGVPVAASVIFVMPAGGPSRYQSVSVILPLEVTVGPSVKVSLLLSVGAV